MTIAKKIMGAAYIPFPIRNRTPKTAPTEMTLNTTAFVTILALLDIIRRHLASDYRSESGEYLSIGDAPQKTSIHNWCYFSRKTNLNLSGISSNQFARN
jgi:hypothetical protein